MKSKILVTGGKGFIGRRIVDELQGRGASCMTYDLVDGQDIRDPFTLAKAINDFRPNAVLHLAARAGAKLGESYKDEYVTTNVMGTYNVVRCTEEAGINVLVHFSSSSVLGGCEADGPGLYSDSPYDPKGVYGETKMHGELIVKNAKGIPLRAVVRPFSVYGEDGRPDMVLGRWCDAVKEGRPIHFYGDGKSVRGYTYVGDVAEATVSLLLDGLMHDGRFRIHHFGGTEKITLAHLLDLFTVVVKESGREVKAIRNDRKDWDIENSFAAPTGKPEWGFGSSRPFDERVKEIILCNLING